MKIIEAVRLGVLGFALSLLCGVVAVPAFASENDAPEDWKADIISEVRDIANAAFEKAKGSEFPGAEFNMANAMYHNMSGFCAGYAHNAQIPTPESIVELSVAIHKDFMRGKIPSEKTIFRLGELCLNRTEEVLVKKGFSQGEIQELLVPAVKELLLQIRKNLGLEQ